MRGAGAGIQRLCQAVDEGHGPPVRGSIDGVDGVGDEEPFAQLEVVRGDGQEGVEELGRLQHARRVVRVVGLGGVEGREGVVQLGVDDGPKGCEMHGGGLEDEGSEDHVDL